MLKMTRLTQTFTIRINLPKSPRASGSTFLDRFSPSFTPLKEFTCLPLCQLSHSKMYTMPAGELCQKSTTNKIVIHRPADLHS